MGASLWEGVICESEFASPWLGVFCQQTLYRRSHPLTPTVFEKELALLFRNS